MPNRNYCGTNDVNLITCDLSNTTYKSCQPTEKSCRFAYASWCPVCNIHERRRTKSECLETPFRRRHRDMMKTPSPKPTNFEHRLSPLNGNIDSRVRELPTTYINNCQTYVPSQSHATSHDTHKQIKNGQDNSYSSEQKKFVPRRRLPVPEKPKPIEIIHTAAAVRRRLPAQPQPLASNTISSIIDSSTKRSKAIQQPVKKPRSDLPTLPISTKNAVKLLATPASVKSRRKLSASKLRKVFTNIAHSVSSDSSFESSSDSECDRVNEDDDDDDDGAKSEASGSDVLAPPSNISVDSLYGSTPIEATTANITTSLNKVETSQWPIRSSLFPHIPPYILFSSHDSSAFNLRPGVGRTLKWRLSTITPVVVRKTLTASGFRLIRSDSNDWIGTWGKHIKSNLFQTLKDSQKLNHFPGTFQIGRKDRLWKNLQRLMFKFGQKEFGFIPRTFVLPHDLKLLRHAWERTGQERWIIKPPASARGTGIRVIHRWAHLPKKKALVVQQYISNPYLINGSKFDLRLYVLVTSFNPLRIYLYPDGLVRFASTKYSDDVNSLSDRYMHLTNYSINKLSSHYTANEDANACKGHKWTLSKLWEYLGNDGVNTKSLWRSLQQLVIKTILCGESSISQLYKANVHSRYNCYELFGIDVLLDERLKPWLLEVNISPSLHSASPLDLHVKGPLVQTLLNLAQFHLPTKVNRIPNAPASYNRDLYTTQLSTKERLKQIHFTEFETREGYLNDIITDLTGDDVRYLTQAEDELTVIGNFERIFPTRHTYYYLQFMETRYYNRLFDAWETKYERNRSSGIKLLQALCEKKIHLDVPPAPVSQNLPNENDGKTTESSNPSPDLATLGNSISISSPLVPIKTQQQTSRLETVTNNNIYGGVHQRMMNLKLGSHRPVTPF